MITVECSHCRARFRFDPSKIGAKGVRLRCAKCKKVFHVPPPSPVAKKEPQAAPPPQPPAPEAQAEGDDLWAVAGIESTRLTSGEENGGEAGATPSFSELFERETGLETSSKLATKNVWESFRTGAAPSTSAQEGTPSAVVQEKEGGETAPRATSQAAPARMPETASALGDHSKTQEKKSHDWIAFDDMASVTGSTAKETSPRKAETDEAANAVGTPAEAVEAADAQPQAKKAAVDEKDVWAAFEEFSNMAGSSPSQLTGERKGLKPLSSVHASYPAEEKPDSWMSQGTPIGRIELKSAPAVPRVQRRTTSSVLLMSPTPQGHRFLRAVSAVVVCVGGILLGLAAMGVKPTPRALSLLVKYSLRKVPAEVLIVSDRAWHETTYPGRKALDVQGEIFNNTPNPAQAVDLRLEVFSPSGEYVTHTQERCCNGDLAPFTAVPFRIRLELPEGRIGKYRLTVAGKP